MRPTEVSPSRLEARDPVASFEIWPHRSLGRKGTLVLMGVVALAALLVLLRSPAATILPLAAGPFFTVGALGLALWSNNRAGRRGELVEVLPDVVRITRMGLHGPEATTEFRTGWVRVVLTQDRHVANRVTLTESGRRLSIGECLSPEERKSLSDALRTSLAAARAAGSTH